MLTLFGFVVRRGVSRAAEPPPPIFREKIELPMDRKFFYFLSRRRRHAKRIQHF
jgi:hypothetical protein